MHYSPVQGQSQLISNDLAESTSSSLFLQLSSVASLLHFVHSCTAVFQHLLNSLQTAAYVCHVVPATGTLLCVLLPPLIHTASSGGTKTKLQTVVTSAALPLWSVAAVTTASGRVLGDAHWISDTMAGACLGAGLVSLTTVVCNRLAPYDK